MADRIRDARSCARQRSGGTNARLSGARLRAACGLGRTEEALAASIAVTGNLSARGVERLLRVGRTIADLDGADVVRGAHLEEAARFRLPVRTTPGRNAA